MRMYEEREKKVLLAASVGLSFPGIYSQRKMTNEWGKNKRPLSTAITAGASLSVINIGNGDKRSSASSPSQLLTGGYAGV